MAKERRRSGMLGFLVVFLLGAGAGYWFRDRRADEQIAAAASETKQRVQATALEAIERAQRAGSDLTAGAEAAAESTKAAFRELTAPDSQ